MPSRAREERYVWTCGSVVMHVCVFCLYKRAYSVGARKGRRGSSLKGESTRARWEAQNEETEVQT